MFRAPAKRYPKPILLLMALGLAPTAALGQEGEVPPLIPAEKGLLPAWLKALTEGGTPRRIRGKAIGNIGMPVGGIGAGQLYLRGDGTLSCWHLFNRRNFSGYGRGRYALSLPVTDVAAGFAISVETGAGKILKKLDRQDFPGVEFLGQYPIGRIFYRDPDFPVTVEMEAFSPFIPLNAPDSALPATMFFITVRNTGKEPVRLRTLGWLENIVGRHTGVGFPGKRRTDFLAPGFLQHSLKGSLPAEKVRSKLVFADFEGDDFGAWEETGTAFGAKPVAGALTRQQDVTGYLGRGMANSFHGLDKPVGTLTSPEFTIERNYIHFLIGGGKRPTKTCVELVVDGKVLHRATGRGSERMRWDRWGVTALAGKKARFRIADRDSENWGHILVDQVVFSDSPLCGPAASAADMPDIGTMVLAGLGPEADDGAKVIAANPGLLPYPALSKGSAQYPVTEKRVGFLTTPEQVLRPGEERVFPFVLAWHFPNHRHGHEYCRRFSDAAEVATYISDNCQRLAGETRCWRDTYYDSTLPCWLLERIGSTNSYLATGTCQWWQNGRFWAYEGVGCCYGTCTHVWNYAHGHARLFPELSRSMREMQDLSLAMGITGQVGFRCEEPGRLSGYAADGQCGTVLKCYREHLLSPDYNFLAKNWPQIKRALRFSIIQDGNEDGLIENRQHNTYDISFYGANTFVGSLYLAALRAGEEMAREMGETALADRLGRIFSRGSKLTVERLWNGEYFNQQVDLAKHAKYQVGDGCLADQLFGQGWAHQLDLGYLYPEKLVSQTLQSIWHYNWVADVGPYNTKFTPERVFADPGEAGLFICTWPKSARLETSGVRYRNEVWTGIEYQVAGHMIWEGQVQDALAMLKGVDERYDPVKRNPYNEIECGDHYARALAAWGAYLALGGFSHHGPKGELGFRPALTPDDFKCAFTTATGWGTFSQRRRGCQQENSLRLRWGRLPLRRLRLELPVNAESCQINAFLAGAPIALEVAGKGRQLIIEFSSFEGGLNLHRDLELTLVSRWK